MGVVAPLAQRQVKLIITRSTIQLKPPWQYCSYVHNSPSKNNALAWFLGLKANFSITAVVDIKVDIDHVSSCSRDKTEEHNRFSR